MYKITARSIIDFMEIWPFKTKKDAEAYVKKENYTVTEKTTCTLCQNIKEKTFLNFGLIKKI